MSDDITKDPEYIRGYEKAKQQIEEDQGAYNQGWHAAYREEREKTVKYPVKATITEEETPQFRKEAISIMKDLIAYSRENTGAIKDLDERLKKLEKYTEE